MFFKKNNKERILRNPQKTNKRRAVTIFKILALFGILLVGIYFLKRTQFLFVKSVGIEAAGANCADTKKIEQIILNTRPNMVFVNNAQIKKGIKEKFLCIADIEIFKKFPDALLVKMEGRKGALSVKKLKFEPATSELSIDEASASSQEAKLSEVNFDSALEEGIFVADKEGFIFTQENLEGLARADFINYELGLGKSLPEGLAEKILIINEELPKISAPAEKIRIWGNRIIAESEPKITFSAVKDIKRQLASLQLIFQKARMDSKTLEAVDLRFDKPVVVYKSKK